MSGLWAPFWLWAGVTLESMWPDLIFSSYSFTYSHGCLSWLLSPPIRHHRGVGLLCECPGNHMPDSPQVITKLQSLGPISESLKLNLWGWDSRLWAYRKDWPWPMVEFLRQPVTYKSCFTCTWGQKLAAFPESLHLLLRTPVSNQMQMSPGSVTPSPLPSTWAFHFFSSLVLAAWALLPVSLCFSKWTDHTESQC